MSHSKRRKHSKYSSRREGGVNWLLIGGALIAAYLIFNGGAAAGMAMTVDTLTQPDPDPWTDGYDAMTPILNTIPE